MRNVLYPFKWPLIALLFGLLVRVIGAMIKILHWPGADLVLIAGTCLMATGIVWLMVKMISLKKESN